MEIGTRRYELTYDFTDSTVSYPTVPVFVGGGVFRGSGSRKRIKIMPLAVVRYIAIIRKIDEVLSLACKLRFT